MSSNLIGQVLLKRYRVDAFVAAGKMGSVYRVWDLQRSAYLAMKVLHSDTADDPAAFSSFEREAQSLESLAHPNIVPFYGVHRTQAFDFLLEGFMDGPSLKDLLRQRQGAPLPVAEALIYLKALCAALGYAHHRGYVHCDIKPANVMLDSGGKVYLADFGIARHADSTTTTLAGAGTPAYMAPEQIRGESVGPATDIYALGVLLFELLTGRRPFRGETGASGSPGTGSDAAERVRLAHLTQPPPDPCQLNPHIPRALAGVVLRTLEKDPARRFASAPALFEAACAAAGANPASVPERVILSEPPPPVPPPPPLPLPGDGQPAGAGGRERQKKTALWLLFAAGLVAALVLGFAMMGGGRDNGEPAQTADAPATEVAAVTGQTTAPPNRAPTRHPSGRLQHCQPPPCRHRPQSPRPPCPPAIGARGSSSSRCAAVRAGSATCTPWIWPAAATRSRFMCSPGRASWLPSGRRMGSTWPFMSSRPKTCWCFPQPAAKPADAGKRLQHARLAARQPDPGVPQERRLYVGGGPFGQPEPGGRIGARPGPAGLVAAGRLSGLRRVPRRRGDAPLPGAHIRRAGSIDSRAGGRELRPGLVTRRAVDCLPV